MGLPETETTAEVVEPPDQSADSLTSNTLSATTTAGSGSWTSLAVFAGGGVLAEAVSAKHCITSVVPHSFANVRLHVRHTASPVGQSIWRLMIRGKLTPD
jgi:hypothetical protein